MKDVRRDRQWSAARERLLDAVLLAEQRDAEARGRPVHGERIGAVGGLNRRFAGQRAVRERVRDREARQRTGKDVRELALPRGDDRFDCRGRKNEQIGHRSRRIGEHVAQSDEATHRVSVEHHR
ncbi:MAG: hypothetical protein AABM32_07145 [Chloroflexota bacterium]